MENKVRQVVVYKDYFQSFFAQQDRKVQDKIIKILDIIEQLERVPESYLKIGKKNISDILLLRWRKSRHFALWR